MYDFLVVGAGLAGCVVADRLARVLGKRVLLVEKRCHIGGNAYDYYNEDGVLVHKYGPHIFHTNSKEVIDYLSQFTAWRPYYHRVLACIDGQLLPFPINLDTINMLYGYKFNSREMEEYLARVREPVTEIRTSEDVIISQVGRDLYEKFFRGYTRKQWGLDPAELNASVARRIPVRTNRDDRYFTDRYQYMPLHGYTKLFERMLNHPKISIMLGTAFIDVADEVRFNKLVYTGPIDEFFDYKYGPLPYRSLQFEFQTMDADFVQPVGTINYPNDYEFTRVTEFKHLTGQKHHKTTIVREYSRGEGEPYYPVLNQESQSIYRKYADEAKKLNSVWFVGRLANYKYYNMDQVVEAALAVTNEIIKAEQ